MRGELLNIQAVVLRANLYPALEEVLKDHFARDLRIAKLERRLSAYSSSFILEELDVTLDDGTSLALIFKDLSKVALMEGAGKIKPWFLYNPSREIETYRRVLSDHNIGSPICYGAIVQPGWHRFWLFLERLPPVHLWQMGGFEQWKVTARWLAGMHTCLKRDAAVRESEHIAHLLDYDMEFYRRWMQRAVKFVCEGDKSADQKHAKAIRWLESRYEHAIERLISLPVTVIHGEFFASNVLLDQTGENLRVCPVDWEMAALAPGLIDLAALTSGNWTSAQKDEMAIEYYDALPSHMTTGLDQRTFLIDLEYCRLAQAIQWLGWSPAWEPPPEHAQDWLKEAIRAAESVSL